MAASGCVFHSVSHVVRVKDAELRSAWPLPAKGFTGRFSIGTPPVETALAGGMVLRLGSDVIVLRDYGG